MKHTSVGSLILQRELILRLERCDGLITHSPVGPSSQSTSAENGSTVVKRKRGRPKPQPKLKVSLLKHKRKYKGITKSKPRVVSCSCVMCHVRHISPKASKGQPLTQSTRKRKSYLCKICDTTFNFWNQFSSHMLNHQKSNKINKVYSCNECNKVYKYKKIFIKHKLKHHTRKDNSLQCSICHQHLSEETFFFYSFQSTGLDSYRCKACDRKSNCEPFQTQLEKYPAYRYNSFICAICEQMFSKKSDLSTHVMCLHVL